jgi:PEP-CTERM motif
MTHRSILACLCGLAVLCSSAVAGELIPNLTVSADRNGSPGYNLANIVNGVGLTDNTPSLDARHDWPSQANAWHSSPVVNINFDLHGEYFLDTMCVWQWSAYGLASVKDVEVAYSFNGSGYTKIFGIDEFPNMGNYANQWQVRFDFNEVLATHVRLKIMDNWGYRTVPNNFAYFGINEVQFGGRPIPEPATLGLLAMGGLAMIRRRRRF